MIVHSLEDLAVNHSRSFDERTRDRQYPELRFSCIRVGSTDGTEFARDFSLELSAELLPTWVALGRLPARFMHAPELGVALADTLAIAVAASGLDVQGLVFRAPGGARLGDMGVVLDRVQQQAARATV